MTVMNLKRRRAPSTLAAAIIIVTATLMGISSGEEVDNQDSSLHPTNSKLHDDATNHEDRVDNADDLIYPHPPSLRRHLQSTAAETFASFTPSKVRHAMPLDLKIDESTGDAYVAGPNGFLEPYAATFAARVGKEFDEGNGYWDGIKELDVDVMRGDDVHSQSDRLYYKILEEDGLAGGASRHGKTSLRGGRDKDRKLVELEAVAGTVHLDSIGFSPMNPSDGYSTDPAGSSDVFLSQDEEYEAPTIMQGRSLQDNSDVPEDQYIPPTNSNAKTFAAATTAKPNQDEMKTRGRYSDLYAENNYRGRNNNKNNKNNKKKANQNKQKRKFPSIDRINPRADSSIASKQSFSARVSPSIATGQPIAKVTFQLTDHTGSSSDWISMPQVDEDLYELTVEGFRKHQGTSWSFVVQTIDEKGKKKATEDIKFHVDGNGSNNHRPQNQAPPAPTPNLPSSSNTDLMAKTKESDGNWKNGGSIQSSTGRILFEFDGFDETFVCSGTVIKDGQRGKRTDLDNGRSIIQTAAHCAYSDQLGMFASKAMFIPDQVSTKGGKSDFDCSNDKYGCWSMSFAVVGKGWTESSFPKNVEWDYAYYVVFDDKNTHSRGYKAGLTGQLDRDVDAVTVDFDADPLKKKEFIISIGYSADKDPDLRHCSMENTQINGVVWYDNLWLDDCAMTGGASGGGWISNMDTKGVGTLVGVNSWGFTDKAGMASPNLSTESGSWAECLFKKAQSAGDPGSKGGYIVGNC